MWTKYGQNLKMYIAYLKLNDPENREFSCIYNILEHITILAK